MFGGYRRGHHRHSRGGANIGLFLLAMQVIQFGIDNIPTVTLITLILNCAIFLHFPPDFVVPLKKACVSFTNVWYLSEWQRLFLAPWYHTSDMHLYYNMSSLLWKGRKLERRFGSLAFAVTLFYFSILSTVLTVVLSYAASELLENVSYLSQCAAGFSGVLFALKVLVSYYESESSFSRVLFLTVPTKVAFWFELVLIQILVPNVSFVGHLAGILTGLFYVKGPLKPVVKTTTNLLRSIAYGTPFSYSQPRFIPTASPVGGGQYNRSHNSPYWFNNSASGNFMSEEEQMNWAMRDSMSTSHNTYPRASSSTQNQNQRPNLYPNLRDLQPDYSANPGTEPSAPPEESIHGSSFSPNSQNDNYPDIGFVRRQRLNRYN